MISKNIAKLNNKKIIFLILLLICIIMITVMKTYCDENVPTAVSIGYDNKTLSFYSDFIKFHVKANGYEKIKSEEMENNFFKYSDGGPGREAETENAKMKGYGQYVFKMETTLLDFVRYCYSLNPGMTMACSYREQTDSSVGWDYTKLSTYPEKVLTNEIQKLVDYFWKNMARELGEPFNRYQDLYFYDRFTNKGVIQVFDNLRKLEENGKEFLTCMMSYMFSTNQNSAPNCKIRKGDVVPFLYVKEHTKIRSIKNSPKEIARYAYVACINGWGENIGNDLWLEEYETMFGIYDEDALCEPFENEDEWVDMETLEQWYLETEEKYRDEKGDKGNPLLGSTITEIIQSDYNIRQQVEATDYFLTNIEGIGDYKENMARNELMAKYMMENEHIQDIIKDYDVGITFITENLQRGTSESKNTKTAVLSDFQVLEFEHTLNVDGHSDDDGISDLTELTNQKKWVDITGPATKTYYDALHSGKTTKSIDAVFADYAEKSPGIVKYENNKLYYNTYDYDSNPMLNDTDFDGIDDDKDNHKTDGTFEANSKPIGKVEWTNDFRYFFIDNEKYNDELATMSLMLCNLADGNQINGSDASGSILTYLNKIGFIDVTSKNIFRISPVESINGKLYMGKKTIQVGGNKKSLKRFKDVYGIFLGGFDTERNYEKLLSNFSKKEVADFYESIVNDIVTYIDNNKPHTENPYCYWLCGYSIAGGITDEVAARLTEDRNGEVYCYTFGATNTNTKGSGAYGCIKNIINEDDLYPKIYNVSDGFVRSGMLYNDSIYDNVKREYRELTDDVKDYNATPKRTNTIKKYLQEVRSVVSKDDWLHTWEKIFATYLKSYRQIYEVFNDVLHPFQSYHSTRLKEVLNERAKEVEKAHEIKSYYVLSKTLNGYDLNNADEGWSEYEEEVKSDKDEEDINRYPESVVSAIETIGNWYIQNVPTYQREEKAGRTTQTQRNNKDLKKEWGINLYNCPPLKNEASAYTEQTIRKMQSDYKEEYETKRLPTDQLKEFLWTAGDDCVRFGMAVYNYVTKGKLIDLHKEILEGLSTTQKKEAYFNYGSTILCRNANTFVNSPYELDDWFYDMGYYRIEVDEDFDIEDLRPGDFLCAASNSDNTYGHVEFYLGFNYEENQDGVYDRGMSVQRINNTDNDRGKAESTYGWGNVMSKMPSYELFNGKEYNWYFYKSADDKSIYRCRGYHENLGRVEGTNKFRLKHIGKGTTEEKECCCDTRPYNVIYRQNRY